jgi:gliding motility-associated-like protein
MPPACQGGLIDLFGYPFGGTWAGPGLVDAKEGIFNTEVIGTGVKTFTYETESCAYTGKLQIRIEPPVRAILDGAEQQYVCIGSAVNKVIGIIPQDGCSYEWYYRADASKPFEIIEGNTASITITKRGDYQVKVYNRVCQTFSPVVSVLEQSIDLTLTPVKPACNDKSVFIDLTASPIGGQWSGPGVNNNLFNPDLLAAGVYTLSYSFKSPEGCVFQNSLQVQVEQPFNTVIKNLEGDLCKEGNVTLGIQGNVPDGMKITWYKFDSQSNQYAIAEEDKIQILVTEKGIYKAEVGNQVCNGLSEPITVNADLKISLTPEENKKEICSDEIYTLTFAETPGATFQWYYASGEGEIPQLLNVSERELKVDQTGYYMGVASRGVCRFESEPKYILVLPAEETLIPDVITPNGDGYNETFQVVSNQDIETIDIYNRYGKNIFSGSGSSKWDGHNFESGVYYWYVTYTNCKNEKITSKGWVHLVR